MNRNDLVEKISTAHQLSKSQANQILATVLDTVVGAVKKGDTVSIVGFGTFKTSSRGARTGRNPKTGEKLKIAAMKVPKFTAGAGFKASVDPKAAARKAAKTAGAKAAAAPRASKTALTAKTAKAAKAAKTAKTAKR